MIYSSINFKQALFSYEIIKFSLEIINTANKKKTCDNIVN